MVISNYHKTEILKLINFFKNFSGDSYNLLGCWCHKGVLNCNESVIDKVIHKKIDFALLDNSLCTKVTEVTITRELNVYEIKNDKQKKQ